jgi:hypothetical protein
MAVKSQIPQPREPILDGRGGLSRTWYRFLNTLGAASGMLAAPITVPNNSIFISGTLNSGSSLEVAPFPPGTLLGNENDVAAPPGTIVVTGGLMLSTDGLTLAELPVNSLLGNASQTKAAVPGAIKLGSGLSFSGNVLNVASAATPISTFPMSVAVASWGP